MSQLIIEQQNAKAEKRGRAGQGGDCSRISHTVYEPLQKDIRMGWEVLHQSSMHKDRKSCSKVNHIFPKERVTTCVLHIRTN